MSALMDLARGWFADFGEMQRPAPAEPVVARGTPDYLEFDPTRGPGMVPGAWARGLPRETVQQVLDARGDLVFRRDAEGVYRPDLSTIRRGIPWWGWALAAGAGFLLLSK